MKKIRFFSFLTLSAIVLLSCSKDKQLNKWLERKDGKWKISVYDVVEYENGEQVDHDTANDAGTFIFDDGDVTISLAYDNAVSSYNGHYTASAQIISYEVNGTTQVLNIDKSSKERLELSTSETYTFEQDVYVNEIKYILER